jgi:hypothetical protein
MANNQKNEVKGGGAGWGAGIAATVAAAAIGAYFLYGKDGAKNRKKVKGWMLKAKGEILEKVEALENVSEGKYQQIVEEVAARYRGARNVDKAELVALITDAKRHWKTMKKIVAKPRSGKKVAKRSVKKSSGKSK